MFVGKKSPLTTPDARASRSRSEVREKRKQAKVTPFRRFHPRFCAWLPARLSREVRTLGARQAPNVVGGGACAAPVHLGALRTTGAHRLQAASLQERSLLRQALTAQVRRTSA
eukprot:scaffold116253_cov33-Phaeocystis_antarctica.AAC.2